MTINCFIRYEIDPFKRSLFKAYAENCGRTGPRCGGDRERFILEEERRFTEVDDAAFQRPARELQEA